LQFRCNLSCICASHAIGNYKKLNTFDFCVLTSRIVNFHPVIINITKNQVGIFIMVPLSSNALYSQKRSFMNRENEDLLFNYLILTPIYLLTRQIKPGKLPGNCTPGLKYLENRAPRLFYHFQNENLQFLQCPSEFQVKSSKNIIECEIPVKSSGDAAEE